jgi:hypothetical protein
MTIAAVELDLRDPVALRGELEEASRMLAETDDVPARVVSAVRELHATLAGLDPTAWQTDVDPYFMVDLQQATMAAREAADVGDAAELELAVEGLLDALDDIEDAATVRDDRPVSELLAWLKEHTGASNSELAELLEASERTVERWLSTRDRPAPTGDDELRIRLLGRLVGQLRHAMTGRGALRWLSLPHPGLRRRAPRELLLDPATSTRLFSLARATRVSDAA